MSRDDSGLTNVSGALRDTLRRLGLTEMEALLRIMNEWDQLAGSPWAGISSPALLREGELVVEATTRSSVRILRYATGELLDKLERFCGQGVVESVRVVGPS